MKIEFKTEEEKYIPVILGCMTDLLKCDAAESGTIQQELISAYLYGAPDRMFEALQEICLENILKRAATEERPLEALKTNPDAISKLVAVEALALTNNSIRACQNFWVHRNAEFFLQDPDRRFAFMPYYLAGVEEMSKVLPIVIRVLKPLGLWAADSYNGESETLFARSYAIGSLGWAKEKGIISENAQMIPKNSAERTRRMESLQKYLMTAPHVNLPENIRDALQQKPIASEVTRQIAERIPWLKLR